MFERRRRTALALALLLGALFVAPCLADEFKGEVTRKGFGKFFILDANGAERLILESSKQTAYVPPDWRPMEGDVVEVAGVAKSTNAGTGLVASSVKLVTAGENSAPIENPATVEVLEFGKSGIVVRLVPGGRKAKFWFGRRTSWVPAGWKPIAGEKATVAFTTETRGFMLKHMAETVTKAE